MSSKRRPNAARWTLKAESRALSVLVVAGWDPSGAAGLAQDLKVLAALGVHACGAPAVLTAQGSRAVAQLEGVSPALLQAQLAGLIHEQPLRAVKLGLLYGAAQAKVVVDALALLPRLPVVLDPVLSASAGGALVREDLLPFLKAQLLPRTTLLTPNLLEGAALSGRPLPKDRAQMLEMAVALLRLGPKAILLKGGHLDGEASPDLYLDGDVEQWLEAPRVKTANLRGTGCALSSAIAAALAQGLGPLEACQSAKAFVLKALQANADQVWGGPGPLLWNFKQVS